MNVLILGNGGREHAFAWKISQSSICKKLVIAPGNPGTEKIGKNVALDITNFEDIKFLVLKENIDLMIVGPEGPLVNGIFDFFQHDTLLKKITVIGPSKTGAKLEGSKQFAKEFMKRHNIPTAHYRAFKKTELQLGYDFLATLAPPFVLKADGLAGGKGVVILETLEEARLELKYMLENEKFGKASSTVVIEEFLDGVELSVFVITDGESYKILPTAKDYKRIGEKDTGLNTGGMGAVSPVPFADKFFMQKVENEIIKPTILGLKKENIIYQGFIFFGLIKVKNNPKVIEYNVRMGDPETEVVIPRIKSDLLDLLKGIRDNTFSEKDLQFCKEYSTTIILVSAGYPESYSIGESIHGIETVNDCIVFHAGTKRTDKNLITNGGRVVAITSYGENMLLALEKSFVAATKIDFKGKYYRKDIGKDLLTMSI
ncbi:MAG: phosphoribosylamine--glycine ligase [Bacteroidota bacterium]|nr:phosphoribosylamine--glycine ligase [Bacteroidota bacterium]